jgi:hypothetical protein
MDKKLKYEINNALDELVGGCILCCEKHLFKILDEYTGEDALANFTIHIPKHKVVTEQQFKQFKEVHGFDYTEENVNEFFKQPCYVPSTPKVICTAIQTALNINSDLGVYKLVGYDIKTVVEAISAAYDVTVERDSVDFLANKIFKKRRDLGFVDMTVEQAFFYDRYLDDYGLTTSMEVYTEYLQQGSFDSYLKFLSENPGFEIRRSK